jgi:DNA repair protein RadC
VNSRRGRLREPVGIPRDPESIVGEVRALWDAVGRADPSRRAKLYEKIVRDIQKLRKQVEDQLRGRPDGPTSFPLFQHLVPGDGQATTAAPPGQESARFPEPILRLYDKDLADQALAVLPQASRYSDLDAFREHLAESLPFNAESTRRRAANYLTGRYFPCGIIHEDLARFADASAGQPWLTDVLFYLTCRVEKIVASVADEIVWPSLADGGVTRKRITDYVGAQVPGWSPNSVKDVGAAIVRTYERLGIGSTTKARLNVASRRGDLPAFAYLLHLEFPEPGMFAFDRLLQGPLRRWLLWDPEWMVKQLYACGETGLIAKVSEIDGTRQFTTRYHLDEAVGPILSLIR